MARCSSRIGAGRHVLLPIEEYRKLSGGTANIIDMLAMPGGEDVEFEPPRAVIRHRPANLS